MCRSRNAETKIKRLLSKHLAPGSAPVSGFGVMICFVVSIWFWCWILGCYCTGICCLSSVEEGTWVCRLVSVDSSLIVLRRDSCGCNDTTLTSSQLIPHSRIPQVHEDVVGLWSPTEQLWWFLSFPLIDAATLTVSSGTREISDEQGEAEELQRSLQKSFGSIC